MYLCDSNVSMYYSNSSILINTVRIHNTAATSQLTYWYK